jgi:hypothetical protein
MLLKSETKRQRYVIGGRDRCYSDFGIRSRCGRMREPKAIRRDERMQIAEQHELSTLIQERIGRGQMADCSDEFAERRSEGRFVTDDPARMRALAPLASQGANVRILDVSRGGFKLLISDLLQPGTIVQVHLKKAIVLAEVRYCVPAEVGFHAGVMFQDVFWTAAEV